MAHDNLLQKLFRNQTNKTWVQFLRYILVGGIVFIIDFGSLFILTEVFWDLLPNFSCFSIYTGINC